ncbi:MAG TPA: RING finger protein [Planctomycetota bacterium]
MTLETLCRDWATRVPGAKAFAGGGIVFQRHGIDGRIEFGRRAWDVIFDTHGLAVEAVEVSPAGLWHDLRGALGFQDVQLDDPDFDAAFHVQAAAPEFAASILKPWLRKRLREAALFGGFRWRLSRAGFLLRVDGRAKTSLDLDRWTTVAFDLLDVLPGADGKNRVTLGDARIKAVEDSACGVCGGTLAEGALVRCAKCRVPHHADCWAFNGRCSIFACGGIISARG